MGIADEDVATVRAASDIVAIVTQYTQLRQVGRRWQGLCPFHQERTPSFSVNAEENLYYCFGCQASGDVITFVREIEKLDFVGAVEWLASRTGIILRYTDRAEGETRKRRARLVEVMEKAVEWYHQRLLSSPDAGAARSYLRARGLDGEVVREYQLGWAPNSWDELCRGLGLGEKAAQETGLGFRNSRNRLQDTFRARVMFPIRDAQGDPVSFGGRILPGADDPRNQGKYKNTPETPLYHKSKVLYGLDRAKTSMVSANTAVICEGYTDVIGFQRSGVAGAVATCGTALTDEHVALLKRYAGRLVLAFDADGAGQAAAERFYRWERDHGLQVFVADLPEGMDPADVAQSDPDRLRQAVDGAPPFMRFRLDRAFASADLASPEGRARATEAALALVAEHPDDYVRDQFLMDVAGRVRQEPERLRPQLEAARRRVASGGSNGRPPRGRSRAWSQLEDVPHPADLHSHGRSVQPRRSTEAGDQARRERPELEVLRHAVHSPAEVARWLHAELFSNPLHREVLYCLMQAETLADAIDAAERSDDMVVDMLRRLSVEEAQSEPFEAVTRLLAAAARRELDELRLATATLTDPTEALADSAFLSRCIDELRNDAAAVGAADGLLAWLGQRVGEGG